MRFLGRITKASAAAVALAGLLAGIPATLWLFGARPPSALPTWQELQMLLTTPDTGAVFLGLLTVVGWLAWAAFAVAVAGEVRGLRLGRPARRVRGLGMFQRLAAVLLGALVLVSVSPSLSAATPSGGADSGPHPAATMAAQQEYVPGSDDDEPDELDHQDEADEQGAAPTYVVQPGDSLWSVAERVLGDGAQWSQIAELNYDRTQPDGMSLDRQDRWLHPGWVLQLPAEAAQDQQAGIAPAPAAHAGQASGGGISFSHIVQPGESLRDIAQQHLGDAERYMEVFETNRGLTQDDGGALTDPDHLRPGWNIEFAAAHTGAVATDMPASTHQDEPEIASGELDDRGPTLDQPAPDQAGDQPPPPQADEHALDHAGEQVEATGILTGNWTAWGGGGMLAAGVVSAVSMRRAMTQRRREAGQRLSMPTGPSAILEAELRYVADADGVAMLDASLRELGQWFRERGQPLPRVAAARTQQGAIRMYLDEQAQLPAPWVGTHHDTVWSRPARSQATPAPVEGGSPFPGLVTVGRESRGSSVHVDLEHMGMLSIDGQMGLATSALRALVVELATNPWTEGASIHLVGCLPELAGAIDTGRLRHFDSVSQLQVPLSKAAATTSQILSASSTSHLGEARGRGVARDAWDPQIVVIGSPLSTEESDWLAQLCRDPASGVVAVGLGLETATWTVNVDTEQQASLSPAGLMMRPQLLDEANYRASLEVLARANQTVPGPAWAANLVHDEPGLDPAPAPAAPEQSAPVAQVVQLRPPLVRVLGPVVLDPEQTGPLRPSHEAQALEIVTYLALHDGVDGRRLSEAIWPGAEPVASTRNSAVSRARSWLGEDPGGNPYLRRVEDDGLYELAGLGTDWDHFTALVRPGLAKAPVDDLMAALSLVRGVPFDRSRPGRYTLRAARYAWAEFIAHEMTSSIADVAYAASSRATSAGRAQTGLEAARTGLKVAPWEERLWRCAIRATWAMSDVNGIGDIVNELEEQLAQLEAEPEKQTQDLLEEITTRLSDRNTPKARQAQ